MEALEKKLNYTFRDRALLEEALNHSSYANEHRGGGICSNERLEFLGDSILGFVTAEYLFKTYPGLPEGDPTLPELEQYYRKLDLYFSFAKAFSCPVDEDKLYDSRERVADQINEILLHRLRNNIRFCDRCGKALPLHHRGRLCEACYQRERRRNLNRPYS